jgi:hypothetical protein
MHFLREYSATLEELYSQTLCSRQISRNHLHELQTISVCASLNPQQNRLIKRLLHASRRGWISVTE